MARATSPLWSSLGSNTVLLALLPPFDQLALPLTSPNGRLPRALLASAITGNRWCRSHLAGSYLAPSDCGQVCSVFITLASGLSLPTLTVCPV